MKLIHNREGSFTIEAALVFPIILFSLLILMFFCMYLYQGVVLGQAAIVAAERSAYSWDNSYRNARTGSYEDNKYDSLYWRLSEDGVLQGVFGWGAFSSEAIQLKLPYEGSVSQVLTFKKLFNTAQELPSGMNGVMEYDNKLLYRKVSVSLNQLLTLMPLEGTIGDLTQTGQAESYVVDPVEWIRTVDLIRYYGAKFKGTGEGKADQAEAGEALKKFGK